MGGPLVRWLVPLHRAWRGPRRLSTRFVGLSLALLLLVQAAGFVAIELAVEANARRVLAEELRVGERVWRRLLQQKGDALREGARVLASDYGFRSALGPTGDAATLASAVENAGERIGASITVWVDTSLQVRALHDHDASLHQADAVGAVAAGLAASVHAGGSPREVLVLEGRPLQFVAVPVRAPLLLGWVVMGFGIDQAVIDDMRELSGLQAVLLAGPAGRPRVVAGTLGGLDAEALAAATGDSVVLAGETLLLRRVELQAATAVAAGGEAQLLLLRSLDEARSQYGGLRWLLALITGGGVLVFAVGIGLTAQRVTTPLRALAAATARLGRGDYGVAVAETGRRDELGDLARAFDAMRGNLAGHEAEIRRLAYWDRLTGLPNRTQFRDALESAIAAAAQPAAQGADQPAPRVAVVLLDLDRFKHVNDVLGYAFGDRLLRAVAERLRLEVLRGGDLVARLSGDEFALLLPGSSGAQALAVCERMAAAFEQPLMLDEHTVDIAASCGVACWPEHAADPDTLISHAEIAMHGAKRRTVPALLFDPAIDAGSAQTLSLLSELRQAIERQELRLYLQPKVDLASGCLLGAEALVRWQHPARGLVPPMAFIPFAEQTGFVRQLTLWVVEEAARQWPLLRALGMQRLSVNLSTRDLLDQDLLPKLLARLGRHGAPAAAFCLEITESAIMEEPQRALATLNALSAAGFKLSIDDFGTGYSSLAYLKKLPVDELKIDRSFVMAMADDADDAKIVRSTIELAHTLGLTVVAEGVETAAILQQLRALRCDEAQGYFITRPLPAGDLPAFAAQWNATQPMELSPQAR